jgi:hypothetical protein
MKKLIFILLPLVIFGGGYFVVYKQATNELELATLKSDLDGMYKALQNLSMLQLPEANNKLSDISKAIIIREQMLQAVADHDHEHAINKATQLLDSFPQHIDGTKVLRESGQIFFLLRSALDTARGALKSEAPKEVKFENANAASEESVKKNTEIATNEYLEKKFYNVNKARELAHKAVLLDPHFERAIKLENDLDFAHEAMALTSSENAIKIGNNIFSLAQSSHNTLARVLSKAAYQGTLSFVYGKAEPLLLLQKKAFSILQSEMDFRMILVNTYKGERSKEYFNSLRDFAQVVRTSIDTLLIPTGNLIQFGQAANDSVRDYNNTSSKIESSKPNSQEISLSIDAYSKVLLEYQLFKDSKTENAINQHLDLYSI